MKLSKLFLFIALIAATVSCKSDDDSNMQINAELAGTWSATGIDFTGTTATEFMGVTLNVAAVGTGTNINYSITLSEDPNIVLATGMFDLELTLTAPGVPPQTQTLTDQMPVGGGTWEQNGNTVSFTENGETTVVNIDVLTATDLQLSFSETETTTQPNGAIVTESTNLVMTFTRQ